MGSSRSTCRGTGIRTSFSSREQTSIRKASTRLRIWEDQSAEIRRNSDARGEKLCGRLSGGRLGVRLAIAVRLLDDRRERGYMLRAAEAHDDNALRCPAQTLDI